jgi:hypothetical protein
MCGRPVFSAAFFLCFTFLLSFWLGPTLRFALAGMAIGGVLGLLGMYVTAVGKPPRGILLHSQPLACPARDAGNRSASYLLDGGTRCIAALPSDQHWLWSASGTQLSVGVAAGLIGYYLVYAIGVRIRIARHEKRRHD